jgi:ABC-2 type transport system permease protein
LRRILLIAKRDYLQVVTSRAYLIGLIMLPLIIGVSILAVALASRGNTQSQRIAIIDHTGVAAAAIIQGAEAANGIIVSPVGRNPAAQHFLFEEVKPEADEDAQLLSLSNRIRSGELFMVLDIPADALRPPASGDPAPVRYYTNSAGFDATGAQVGSQVNGGLRRARLAQLGLEGSRVSDALREVPLVSMNLVKRDPTGKIVPGEKKSAVPAGLVPYFLVTLLVMVVMIGAAPNMGTIADDKQQRVFEMLLGSATPFELMAGQVLASLGAALTTSALYIACGLALMFNMAMIQLAPLELLPWFFAYLIADVIMMSAWGVAIGSACSTPQDAQQLAYTLILPIMIPVFFMAPIIQRPNGAMAIVMSFIPPFTPVVMLLRQALPGGVPWWQPWVGLAGIIACALGVVWLASRIFRIGILASGKTPKLPELLQWVWER